LKEVANHDGDDNDIPVNAQLVKAVKALLCHFDKHFALRFWADTEKTVGVAIVTIFANGSLIESDGRVLDALDPAASETSVDSPLSLRLNLSEGVLRVITDQIMAVLERVALILRCVLVTVHLVRIRVLVKLVVLILVVSERQLLKLTLQEREVVIRAVREARLSLLAEVMYLFLLMVDVELEDQAHETDGHEQKPDEPRELVEPHVNWQVVLVISTHH
jgi:hypothetical protein